MRQNKKLGQYIAPVRYSFGHRATSVRQIVVDRIPADEEREADLGEEGTQASMPKRRTFPARWHVAAFGVASGIAEADRHDCHAGLVVKGSTIERQPLAQPVAAAVIKRKPALVGAKPWRLTDNQDPRRWSAAQ